MQLIVLGMHRSGTSVLARLLNLMGAYFGPEGIGTGANQENPRGFWERRDVRELNDKVLNSVGCDWNRVAGFDLDAVPAQVVADFRKRAANIVLQMDAYRPWMLKEPRLMLLLPLWRDLLHSPACVRILRSPVEVAASLHTRNQIPMEAGLALWEFYVRRSVAASEGLPLATVSHRRLIKEPATAVAGLLSALEAMGVTGLRMPSAYEIESFVVDELYRERDDRGELRPYLKAPQVKLFHALEAGEPLPRPGRDLAEAGMRHLRAYEAGLPPLQPKAAPKAPTPDSRVADAVTQLVGEMRRRDRQAAQSDEQRDARLDALLAANQAAADELRQSREASRRLEEDVSARDRRIRELEQQWKADLQQRDAFAADLKARTAQVESLGADLKARTAELESLAGALESARGEIREREASLRAFQSRMDRRDGELERRDREAQRRQQRIAEADAEIAKLRDASERQERELDRAGADLETLRDSLADARKALAGEKQQRLVAEASLEARVEEIVRLTRALMGQDQRVSLLTQDLESANDREARALEALADSRDAAGKAAADATARAAEAASSAASDAARTALLQADLEAAARALVDIVGSRGWRATSKLRSAWSLLVSGRAAKSAPPLWARSLLRESGLFDAQWYLEQYPDVAASGIDAIDHYLSFGASEGRDPSAAFDSGAWRARHPGLARAGINPLVHALLDETRVPASE